jgi:MoaA/NifB/PqqE/SkfB family radical SAM enzyme
MDLALMGRLGLRQLSSILPEALYLSTGIDLTRPTEIRASVTTRCNYKRLQCGCWRCEPGQEMSIVQWEMALASIKEFCGPYRIHFVGGEPFVKKGFLDLLEFCRERSIDFGVITNGSAFANEGVVSRFVAARPLKVDISVDGPTPDIHDRLRGYPGSLASIAADIGKLRDARHRLGVSFPIRIKATLNAVNFRSMTDLVTWAMEHGATSIDIEPIREWTDE